MKVLSVTLTISTAIVATACTPLTRVFDPDSSHETIYGSQPLTEIEVGTPADLPKVIYPDIGPGNDPKYSNQSPSPSLKRTLQSLDLLGLFPSSPQPDYPAQARLADAFVYFDSQPESVKLQRRTEIQEELISKSTLLCSLYKKQMMQAGTVQNLIMGDTSTLLSGLGAIFAKASVVRPLAGAGAITNAFRAEYNSDVFANLNLQVITSGMEKRRSEYYAAILKTRSCTIQQYPLQQAIKDAFYFHSSCSLYAGLEEASLAVKQAQEPGLDQLQATLQKFNTIRASLGEKALGSTSGTASAPGSTTETAQSFGISPTGQSVSSNCSLPIPGTPKSSTPAAATIDITTSDGKALTLPFANANNPVLAMATATKQITDDTQALTNQYAAAVKTPVTQFNNDLITAKNSATTALAAISPTPATTLANYTRALATIMSDSQSDPNFIADKTALLKAQADNTAQTDKINSIVVDFEKSAGVQNIKLAISGAQKSS